MVRGLSRYHEVRRFIGFASFFKRFVKGFALIARPLTGLLKKDTPWKWSNVDNMAFIGIKEQLINRSILALQDKNLETKLHADASKLDIAGILIQSDREGLWRAVAYFIQTSLDEQKIHTLELETLAMIASLNKVRTYLLGIRWLMSMP